jgi:type II secretory pathway pseudopilin PulG
MARSPVLGATLVEVIVALGIVVLIAGLVTTGAVTAKERGKVAVDTSNMRQLGQAAAIYSSDFDNKGPLSAVQLVNSGLAPPTIVRSPSDLYQAGMVKEFQDAIAMPPEWRIPCAHPVSYVGLGDGNWQWESVEEQIVEEKSAGWLVSFVRARPVGKSAYPRYGPYLRLRFDGGMVARRTASLEGPGGPILGGPLKFKDWFHD